MFLLFSDLEYMSCSLWAILTNIDVSVNVIYSVNMIRNEYNIHVTYSIRSLKSKVHGISYK